MARFHFLTLLAWTSLSGVCSFRTGMRTVTSHAAHSGQGANATAHAQSGSAPPLKLFASTYNAYNRRYEQASAADDMLLPLVQGHEEADIVILGLQEFSDKVSQGQHIFEHVRKDFLWSAQFHQQVQALKDISRRPAPANVIQARDAIVQKFDAFHDRLNTELTALQHFAKNDDTFKADIKSHSPAGKLLGSNVHATEAAKDTIGKLLGEYEENKKTAAEHQFGGLREKLQAIESIANEFNNQDYEGHFSEIENWKEALNQEFFEFHNQNRNFELTGEGRAQYKQLVDGFKEAPNRARQSIQSGSHLKAIKEQLGAFQGKVQQTAMEESEAAVKSAIGRWQRVLQDVTQLETDMAAMKQDGAVLSKIVSEVTSKISQESSQLQETLGTWKTKVREHVQTVGDLAQLDITNAMLEIPVVAETFDSDSTNQQRRSVCHTGSHYDTELRVFAKPWSPWKLNKEKTVKYSIDYNGETGWRPWDGQCGKGVNVVRVTLESGTGHEVNLCVLNAHQSFKFPFPHRLENIEDTLASLEGGKRTNDWQSAPNNVRWQTEDLQCHATVYTADFNTRLMCQVPGEHQEHPLIDSGDSSFMNVVSTFCSGDSCELGSSAQAQADELTQFLTQEKISCFEEESKKKWTLRSDVPNPLFAAKHRLREVDVPNFAPTYKLGDKKATEGKGKKKKPMSEWSKCLADDELCLVNEDQDAKHNPAWTDRILVRDSDFVTVTSDMYERRTYTSVQCDSRHTEAESCSDHAIVSSMMSLSVQEAAL